MTAKTMASHRIKFGIASTLIFSVCLPVAGSILVEHYLSEWHWINEPFHSSIEGAGALLALTLAALLHMRARTEENVAHFTWMSAALISMGLLDGFHGALHVSAAFVWAHGMATLLGGVLFSLVWLPDHFSKTRLRSSLPAFVALTSIVFGLLLVAFPGALPVMADSDRDEFTLLVEAINFIGGVFFVSASVFFLIRYQKHGRRDDFLFAIQTLLFGEAGILFANSTLWDGTWWLWHLVRLFSYIVIAGQCWSAYNSMGELTRRSREELQSVTASISDYLWSGELDSQGYWQNRYYSPATERITGRPPEFYMQGPEQWFSTIHPDDRPRLLRVLESIRTGDSTHVEEDYRILLPDGAVRWVRDSAKIRRENGRIRIDGVVSDITDRKLSEQELHASESKVRALLETAAQAIVAVDASGRIGLVNATTEIMFGYKREEMLGQPLEMLLPERLREIHQETRIEYFSQPRTRSMGIRLDMFGRRKDGTEFPVEVSQGPVEDGGGLVAVSFISDITERKRVEEKSRQLAAIVESSDDAIVSGTLDGVIASWNGGAERTYGYSAEEMVGRPLTVLIPPDCREEYPVILKWIQRGEALEHFVTERLHKDGRRIAVSVAASPVRNAKGEIVGYSSITRDITKQKQMEDALRESEERFRHMGDNAPVLIWMSGTDKLCTWFNKPWLDFVGRPVEKELGNGWTENVHPDDLDRCLRVYTEHFDARQPFMTDYRLRRYDGEYRWVQDTGIPLFDRSGSFTGYIGSCADITDRKRAEEELQAKSAALQESQANLQTLSGQLISARDEETNRLARELHDAFGQTLAVLNLQVSELESLLPSTSDRAKKSLLSLRDGIGSLAQQIQQLSRQLHPAVLRELGLEIAVETECANYSEREGINVTVFFANVPEDLPDDIALCLYRVLQESLQNIRKHAQTKKAEVRLVMRKNEILLAVEDSGKGFELKDARRKGGLGLVSMGERVRTLGGSVSISSRLGQGTLIEVRVPLERR